jgi:hypothetical protein
LYHNCISISYTSVSPASKEELFNLRHASARNVVERIFGVLKRRFRILILPPEYDMGIQARIPAALCALHNFIRRHDPSDIEDYAEADESSRENTGIGDLSTHAINGAERERAHRKRDQIAKEMWDSYQAFIRQEGMDFEAGPSI